MKTLAQHLTDYLSFAKVMNQSPVHLRNLQFAELRLIAWLHEQHGVAVPEKLTPQHLEAWVKHYSNGTTTRGLPRKLTSRSKQFQCDRTFLRWLVKVGALPGNYPALIPMVKLPYRLPTSVLLHKQVDRLLRQVDETSRGGYEFRAALEFLYSSGVRASELLALNVGDVDLAMRTARILGKGAKERVVPFGPMAGRYLETYLRSIRPLLARDGAQTAIWLDAAGQRLPYHTLRRQLEDLADKVRLPVGVTLHTLRRSFATEMLRGGANPYHVAELLGHANVETLKAYAKLTIVDLKRTHNRCHPRERDSK